MMCQRYFNKPVQAELENLRLKNSGFCYEKSSRLIRVKFVLRKIWTKIHLFYLNLLWKKSGVVFKSLTPFLNTHLQYTLTPHICIPFFRLHTQVSGSFQLKDENHAVVATAPLKDLFHLPHTLLVDNTYDQLLRGQSSQSVQVRKFK